MSQQTTINPYSWYLGAGYSIYDYLSPGLEYIIANITGPPTVDDLNAVTVDYTKSVFLYTEETFSDIELNSYLPLAINAYIQRKYNIVTPGTAAIIHQMIKSILNSNPLEIPGIISDYEDKIAETDLSIKEQVPLFFATALGAACYDYWLNIFSTPGGWADYISTDFSANLARLPEWVAASMLVAAYNFKGDFQTNTTRPPKIAGPAIVTAIHAVVGITAGKVLFEWEQNLK